MHATPAKAPAINGGELFLWPAIKASRPSESTRMAKRGSPRNSREKGRKNNAMQRPLKKTGRAKRRYVLAISSGTPSTRNHHGMEYSLKAIVLQRLPRNPCARIPFPWRRLRQRFNFTESRRACSRIANERPGLASGLGA